MADQQPAGFVPDGFVPDAPPPSADFRTSNAKTEDGDAELDPAWERFVGGVWTNLNPLSAVEGVYNMARHPIDTTKELLGAQAEQLKKGRDLFSQGRTSEAIGHVAAALLPIMGPAAAHAGERIGSGDIAGGLGEAVGLLGPEALPLAKPMLGKAASFLPDSFADALDRGATDRVADVMSPKVGRNKVRFGTMAEQVAPEIVKDPEMLNAWSRAGLHDNIGDRLTAAEQALDQAANNRVGARTFPTKPIIDDLLAKRKQFTAEAVEGSTIPRQTQTRTSSILNTSGQPIDVVEPQTTPIGQDVVPAPRQTRVAQIDQAISELRQLGPVTRYEPLRRIREAYDQVARVKYAPSITADFLAKQGEASGAADVTGVLRERLAAADPATAAANAEYSVARRASDVLDATAEVERTRPRVGRQIVTRALTTLIGEHAAGAPGAIVGYVLAPIADAAMNSGVTTKLKTARAMANFATAIRRGDVGAAMFATSQLKTIAGELGIQVEKLTPPKESESPATTPSTTATR